MCQSSSAVNEIEEPATISVFPNPFENEFSIRGIKAKGVAIICDVTGKELVKQNIVDVDDAINTIFLTPGIYLLNYTCGNATANTKIVKFH